MDRDDRYGNYLVLQRGHSRDFIYDIITDDAEMNDIHIFTYTISRFQLISIFIHFFIIARFPKYTVIARSQRPYFAAHRIQYQAHITSHLNDHFFHTADDTTALTHRYQSGGSSIDYMPF
jgi:hypothetical protein